MAASDKTVDQLLEVLMKHLDQEKIREVVNDICLEVEGNKSFEDTMLKLRARLT